MNVQETKYVAVYVLKKRAFKEQSDCMQECDICINCSVPGLRS